MRICQLLSVILGSRRGGGVSTYGISGTVSGDVVSGVTVTLSGDASDSTTTAEDGTYSFTGLVDGSYNVEPSYSSGDIEGVFSPANTDVTVSGGDQVGKDFTETSILALPFTLDINAVTGGNGDALASEDGYSTTGDQGFKISTSPADKNAYTPPGVTKVAWGDSLGDSANIQTAYTLEASVPSGKTGFRAAFLYRAAEDTRTGGFCQIVGDSGTFIQASRTTSGTVYVQAKYTEGGDVNTEINYPAVTGNVGNGTAPTGNEWTWLRIEFDFANETVYCASVKAEANDGKYTQVEMSADGKALGSTFEITKLQMRNNDTSDASRDRFDSQIWVGDLTDAWPDIEV